MKNFGTISAHVFTSNAKIPIVGAGVAFISGKSGRNELIAFRLTNEDGFTDPISVDTPELDSSSVQTTGKEPFTQISVFVEYPGYNRLYIENAQIFTDIASIQPLQLVPTPTLSKTFGQLDVYPIQVQDL